MASSQSKHRYGTVRIRIIENLARTPELPLPVGSIGFFYFIHLSLRLDTISQYLTWGSGLGVGSIKFQAKLPGRAKPPSIE